MFECVHDRMCVCVCVTALYCRKHPLSCVGIYVHVRLAVRVCRRFGWMCMTEKGEKEGMLQCSRQVRQHCSSGHFYLHRKAMSHRKKKLRKKRQKKEKRT